MRKRTLILRGTLAAFGVLAGIQATFAQTITEHAVPTAGSTRDIASGPDGNLWFTESSANKIGRITPAGAFTEYPIPTAASKASEITSGPDGNLWFTESNGNKIGKITPAGVLTEYPVPTAASSPDVITSGPDGNLWFAEFVGNKIGRITPAGAFKEYPTPTAGSHPSGITAGPDGNLWFGEFAGNKIGRITPAGGITEYPIPTAASRPIGITSGPDGNLWFTEADGNKIGRITVAGALVEYGIPTSASDPVGIISGPDGNLWFTEDGAGKIGKITLTGVFTEYPIPTPVSHPSGITPGPDGNVWFTEQDGNKIGTFQIDDLSSIITGVGATAGANGTNFKTAVQLTNAGSVTAIGALVFHPAGATGSPGDPSLAYTVHPGSTQSFPDILGSLGRTGLGSMDVERSSGPLPAATVRVFNDQGAQGTDGYTEGRVLPAQALQTGNSGVLIGPADTSAFRLNVGVRTLGHGVTASLKVLDGSGHTIQTLTKTWNPNFFDLESAASFLGVGSLPDNASIQVTVTSGSAVFFGAIVDNISGDSATQFLTRTISSGLGSGVIVGVGAVAGANGTNFKTALQLTNPTASTMSGAISFAPIGTPASASDPAIPYSLGPGVTESFPDLLGVLQRTGLGTLTIVSGDHHSPTPTASARVFNDQGARGTAGYTEPAFDSAQALKVGDTAVLVGPADSSTFRMNLGVRTVNSGNQVPTSAVLTVRDGSGNLVTSVTKTFPSGAFFDLEAASSFLGGVTLPANASIQIRITSGSAIFFAAVVDNVTGDSAAQFATLETATIGR
ncbi:MAG: virginiamycin B lyase family protein [Thermoanaerobaculia bacterium]